MALTLIKEDGTGLPDANSYADAADGDAYHEGHLYATAWTAAVTGDKEKALVMATRLIDSQYRFLGFRAHETQGLQWPRRAGHQGRAIVGGTWNGETRLWCVDEWVEVNVVPRAVRDATCEMARELLLADRTAAPTGEGIQWVTTGAGVLFNSTRYSKSDTPPIISHVTQAMLSKYGSRISARSGSVKVLRS
jgi:hypothetical protein